MAEAAELRRKQIFLIACGIFGRSYLTRQAAAALRLSSFVIGRQDMLRALSEELSGKRTISVSLSDTERIRDECRKSEENGIAVLLPGDAGFTGTAQAVYNALSDLRCAIVPGISMIGYFAAKTGIFYEDAAIVDLEDGTKSLLPEVYAHRKLFAFGAADMTAYFREILNADLKGVQMYAGEHLGTKNERITRGPLDRMCERVYAGDSVYLFVRPGRMTRRTFGIDDDAFIRGDVPMTKSEVRAVIMSRLSLAETDVVYDIGAGSGSVSVEMALAAPRGCVCAVEVNPQGIELIRRNAEKFGIRNIRPIEGRAPAALAHLPYPDAAFIGGTKGELRSILQVLKSRNPFIRIVLSAITLETAYEALSQMEILGMKPELIEIQTARAKKIGRSHMMTGMNPVFIITGCGSETKEGGNG